MIRNLFKKVQSKYAEGVGHCLQSSKSVSFLVDGMFANDPTIQLECAGLLQKVGEENPQLIYPHFNSLIDLLRRADTLLRLEILRIFCQIAPVDCQHKTEFLRAEVAKAEFYTVMHGL